MKHIHIPTLIMHILLLLLARLTIANYPGFFLGGAILVLIFHLGWAIESKGNFLGSHALGCTLYLLAQPLGFITLGGGFWGMGSEFGWLFYGLALCVSFAILSLLYIARAIRKK